MMQSHHCLRFISVCSSRPRIFLNSENAGFAMSRNEILEARVQILQTHTASVEKAVEKTISGVLDGADHYFEPLAELVDLGLKEHILDRDHQKDVRMLYMNFDEDLLNLRSLVEQEALSVLAGYKQCGLRIRGNMSEEEEVARQRINSAYQNEVQSAIASHTDRMSELKTRSTILISSGLDQLRELQLEETKLESLCERNEKKLRYLITKNDTLRAPVEALAAEVSAMEVKVSHFEKFIKPELEKVKMSSKSLKNEIRERSFILECLTQKLLMLQSDSKSDLHRKAQDMIRDEAFATMSLAETDVTT